MEIVGVLTLDKLGSSSVEDLFDEVAPQYDRLNDLLSLGLHRLWKKQLIDWLQPSKGQKWLDICCGTGDLSFALAKRIGPTGEVVSIDSASQTLAIAKKRSLKKSAHAINWLKTDALDTGLEGNHFDGAVMAYGLRNLSDPFKGLNEMCRVLKKGAKAAVLDFNRLEEGSIGWKFQRFYLRNIVVPIASLSNLKSQYEYLEKSLEHFPKGSIQEELAHDAGFSWATYQVIAGGQMGILWLLK